MSEPTVKDVLQATRKDLELAEERLVKTLYRIDSDATRKQVTSALAKVQGATEIIVKQIEKFPAKIAPPPPPVEKTEDIYPPDEE